MLSVLQYALFFFAAGELLVEGAVLTLFRLIAMLKGTHFR